MAGDGPPSGYRFPSRVEVRILRPGVEEGFFARLFVADSKPPKMTRMRTFATPICVEDSIGSVTLARVFRAGLNRWGDAFGWYG